MAELLPCPFCGAGESRIDHQNMWTGMRNQLVCVHIRHWCEKPSRSHLCITANTEEEAVAEWNGRAAPPPAGAQQAVVEGSTPGVWFVRKREVDGEVVDCFVAAPDCQGLPYDAEILGDDEYRETTPEGFFSIKRKLADCELIVKAVNAHRTALAVPAAAQGALTACREAFREIRSHCWPFPLNNDAGKALNMEKIDKADRLALAALAATPAPEAAPSAKEGEALRLLFLEAIDWRRSYGQRLSLSDVTLQDVAQGYADKAVAALAAPSLKGLTPAGGDR